MAENLYADSQEKLVVTLASSGDKAAFVELVQRRQAWIRGLMLRSCGDRELADDLAQQVFLQAWRKISQLRSPGTFGAWLKKLAINTWLQQLRSRDALHLAEDWEVEPRATSSDAGLAMDLDAALATLPLAPRLCVILAYQEQMSHAEIADATGLALGTVKSHITRSAKLLRARLADYSGGNDPHEH